MVRLLSCGVAACQSLSPPRSRCTSTIINLITTEHRLRNIYTQRSTGCLDLRVKLAGKHLLLDGGWYDPPHFLSRMQEGGQR